MKKSVLPVDQFANRHNGPSRDETQKMLEYLGESSKEDFISKVVPEKIKLNQPLDLSEGISESALLRELRELGSRNKSFRNYIGMGYHGTETPGVILRNIFENPGWYTAYTPYQAEIAQGRMEALINYQTMVMDLTGMELANASLLDEATAAAEAMAMLYSATKRKKGHKFFVAEDIFPQSKALLQTRAEPLGIELVFGDPFNIEVDENFFGGIVQYPNSNGAIHDYRGFVAQMQQVDAKTAFISDLLSLVLLTPPGEIGADVVVGSTQRFGIPLGYGGPHAAYFATRETYKRQVPGRIIGASKDSNGNPALRLALQTREQHIRRDKATSNICTSQVLLAVMAGMYGVYHGPDGLRRIASRIHDQTVLLNNLLTRQLGYTQENELFFDTLKVKVEADVLKKLHASAEQAGINFRYFEDGQHVGISLDETVHPEDVYTIAKLFAEARNQQANGNLQVHEVEKEATLYPDPLARTSDFMNEQVFNRFHTETEMLRYIKRLESRDLSLCQSMIPLGSCTMKLNATTEMIPVSWNEFGSLHPFAPREQANGYFELFEKLEAQLMEITGFEAISFQPNAGAQGEYTGLMTIRAYHLDHHQGHRNVALIPSSAHGTNPASAVMAGMQVVVVDTDNYGNIDAEDLKAKIEKHRDKLGALMVTYPSTHGVFEAGIRDICDMVHEAGGLVYMDGANLNAQVGLTNPAICGADVCHLNLHKTFCIPHGGGGPGMGPIGVNNKLKPYLPNHPLFEVGGDRGIGAISAAPYGSASILLISYAYIRMMGAAGLRDASIYAILNANYMARRLGEHYKLLYTDKQGYVAHEFVIDPRAFKDTCGIQVDDIAKRLIDYGYHAPTMSWPVPGTMMVEPTESESKEELDRFCDAMISIRKEIEAVETGHADKEDHVLKGAPHVQEAVMSDHWNHAYSRSQAAYPLPYLRTYKFWPAVGRVDNTYGDRNLVCSCAPMEAYQDDLEQDAVHAPLSN